MHVHGVHAHMHARACTGSRDQRPVPIEEGFAASVPTTSAKWHPAGKRPHAIVTSKPLPACMSAREDAQLTHGAEEVSVANTSRATRSALAASSWSIGLTFTRQATSPLVCWGSRR